jgi:uncharacterized RDD family membrane protein YckC
MQPAVFLYLTSMQTQYSSEQKDLLDDLDADFSFVLATKEQRLLNLMIDTVVVCALAFLLLMIASQVFFDWYDAMVNNSSITLVSMGYLIALMLYYTLMEAGTKGFTLGKLVSGSRAIGYEGKPVSWKEAFLRSLCRLIPFGFLAALYREWPVLHDKWTSTYVIKK